MINKSYLLFAAVGTFVIHIFEKYFFNDWQFACFLLVLVGVDTILGLVKHFKLHNISSRGFSLVFEKFIIYAAILILTHVIITFPIKGVPNEYFGWLDNAMYSMLMIREGTSVIEKIGAISPGLLPSWILKRLKSFDESGNYKD